LSDLNLKSFDKLYPMIIHKYNELLDDQNENVMDRINTIVAYLNQVGKLTNDVVKDWNLVYQWVMNDGLTTDLTNAINSGAFNSVLATIYNVELGDLTQLQTVDKSNLVAAINENVTQLAQIAYNVKAFGAKGDGSNNDHPFIQAAVNAAHANGGGIVLFPSGATYLINDTIVLYDNITLIAYGATIKLGSVYKNMIVNDGYNTLIRNKNITILGGTFDGGVTADNTQLTSMRTIFAHIDNLTIRDAMFLSTAGNYAISLGDTKDVFIDNIRFNVFKDGIHLQGLNYRTVIQNIYGDSVGDDLVAVTTNDTIYAYVEGEVEDLFIKNIFCNSTNTTRAVLLGCRKFHIKNVTVENVIQYNSDPNAKGVMVGDGGTTESVYVEKLSIKNVDGTVILNHKYIKDVSLENIYKNISLGAEGTTCQIDKFIAKNIVSMNMDSTKTFTVESIEIDGVSGTLTFKDATNIFVKNVDVTVTSAAIQFNGTIDRFVLENSKITSTYTGNDAIFYVNGIINNFILSHCRLTTGSTANSPLFVVAQYILNYKFLNCVISAAKVIASNVASGQNITETILLENTTITCNRIADINDYCSLIVKLNNVDITNTNNIFYCANSNSLTIYGHTIKLSTIGLSGTPVTYCYTPDFKVDASKLTKVVGGRCYNTNSGLSCGVGYLISDGASWKNQFSGATY
jgi:hypothetical protein